MELDLAGIRYELLPKKPKFERDFIMLSEFSELVGPIPLVSVADFTQCILLYRSVLFDTQSLAKTVISGPSLQHRYSMPPALINQVD